MRLNNCVISSASKVHNSNRTCAISYRNSASPFFSANNSNVTNKLKTDLIGFHTWYSVWCLCCTWRTRMRLTNSRQLQFTSPVSRNYND